MPGKIKLPLVGEVPKGWVIVVGSSSVVILGYVYYKHKQAAAAATTGTALVTDPAGNQCATLNPSTGYCPGTAQDAAAMGQGQYGFGAGSGWPPGGTGGPPPTPGPGSFTSNAEWASYVELAVPGDPTTLSAAIGVYLTGRPATPAQVSLIDQAIAIGGYPPVAGPGGFPPNIKQQPGHHHHHGDVTVPNVVGHNKASARRLIHAAGLRERIIGHDDPIQSEDPAAGTKVAKGSLVILHARKGK